MFQESLTLKDDVWDCTLIKNMKEHNDTVVNPIYDWQDRDIWEYIKQEGIEVNPLYAQGYRRIGCIGCPMASYTEKQKDFARYPAYRRNYIKAFERLIRHREEQGMDAVWKNGEDVMDWWIEKGKYEIDGQMTLDDYV